MPELLLISDLRGGRNGDDPPLSLPLTQCVEALNVDWWDGTLARKRGGHLEQSLTGHSVSNTAYGITALVAHHNALTWELWTIARGAAGVVFINRLESGVWTTPTIVDVPSPVVTGMDRLRGASLDNKLFLAYHSAVDRLHVWDGTSIRRTGLAPPVAGPTVANQGGGAYAAVLRYYKVAYIAQTGSDIERRSEVSAATSFTPSGGGLSARVTRPALVNEGETHWELYASADDNLYHLRATTVVATTFVDDTTLPSAYTGEAPPLVGANALFPHVTYLLADDNRILGAIDTRIYFTPALGSSDIGDSERLPDTTGQQNWMDLNTDDGDTIRGFGGPIQGTVFVFKKRQIWRLTPNGGLEPSAPYDVAAVTRAVGAVNQESIVTGEDAEGDPAIYFIAHRGIYRVGKGGVQDLSAGILDRLIDAGLLATVESLPSSHVVWHEQKHQVWFTFDEERLVFDVRTSAWSRHQIARAADAPAVSFYVQASVAVGTGSADTKDLYLSGAIDVTRPLFWKADTGTTDDDEPYQAYVTSRAFAPGGLRSRADVENPVLVAEAGSATITVAMIRDFGAETRTASTSLTASGSETRILRKVQEIAHSGLVSVQYRIGDASALNQTWVLDTLVVPTRVQEPV